MTDIHERFGRLYRWAEEMLTSRRVTTRSADLYGPPSLNSELIDEPYRTGANAAQSECLGSCAGYWGSGLRSPPHLPTQLICTTHCIQPVRAGYRSICRPHECEDTAASRFLTTPTYIFRPVKRSTCKRSSFDSIFWDREFTCDLPSAVMLRCVLCARAH